MGRQAQWMSEYETVDIGPVPNDENCAQVGSEEYDSISLNRMEVQAYVNQLERMFKRIPDGCWFTEISNNHDFGTYYEAGVKYSEMTNDDNNGACEEFSYNVQNNAPEQWDAEAIAELDQQGYFEIIPRKVVDIIDI